VQIPVGPDEWDPQTIANITMSYTSKINLIIRESGEKGYKSTRRLNTIMLDAEKALTIQELKKFLQELDLPQSKKQ